MDLKATKWFLKHTSSKYNFDKELAMMAEPF